MSAAPAERVAEPFESFQAEQLGRKKTRALVRTFVSRAAVLSPVPVAIAAGALALIVSSVMYPLLSENNDEAAYLLQAEALRHGKLFIPAPENWRAFLPALSVFRDGHFVTKYTPVHAGFIAFADLITGTQRAALALTAALASLSAYLLARQVLRTRRAAVMAAAFFTLSPLTIIQSATFLAYLSTLALLQGFAAALLAGMRLQSKWLLSLSGLLFGTAFFSRQFDAVLFAAPFGAWMLWTHRKALRRLSFVTCWVALGALLPISAMLAYFRASTGSWFTSPFNLTDASDTIGFGVRRMYEQSAAIHFTPAKAWLGMVGHMKLIMTWCFGGILLVALAVAALRRMNPKHPGCWVGLVAVSVPVGYFFFWGSYGSLQWSAPYRIGPYYYTAMLTPLAILGAATFDRLWEARRRIAVICLVAMLGFSAFVVKKAGDDVAPYNEVRRGLYEPLLHRRLDQAIVFLPRLTRTWMLTHPYAVARNSPDFSGDVVWALDRGPEANRKVLTEFPDRVAYRVVLLKRWKNRTEGAPSHVKVELRRTGIISCESPGSQALQAPPDLPGSRTPAVRPCRP